MIEKTHHFVEKSCKTAYFIIVQVAVPSVILPKAIVSYFIYFTTDADRSAFELSFQGW